MTSPRNESLVNGGGYVEDVEVSNILQWAPYNLEGHWGAAAVHDVCHRVSHCERGCALTHLA